VHRGSDVKVLVNYGGETAEHVYRPSAHIQRILDWAVTVKKFKVKKFKIDPTIAPEMQLTLDGQTAALPGGAHIGRYAKHGYCLVELNLVRVATCIRVPDMNARSVNRLLRAARLELAQAFQPNGFSYHFGFRRRLTGVRGLDYPFTIASPR
jgi:hypothetical protein